ncbi:MAG: hypothetical protein JW782_07600 [Candidatus Saganbacteria bacterium]|nr:hypothetical protein [Candidatus Saganbacteria bacterium]
MTFTIFCPITFFTGCQARTAASREETETCQPLEAMSFPSPTAAIEHINDFVGADPILAFGYTHRETRSQRSAVGIFAKEILPCLADQGYTDLVLEIFPQGGELDAIELEIAEFNRSGRIGQEMARFLSVRDQANFILLLEQARAHNITIHSGGVDYNNVERTILHPEFTSTPGRLETARQEIARNTRDALTDLSSQGRKIISLNGTVHNDIYPTENNVAASFGSEMSEHFPVAYAAIDLVVPELSERNNYYRDLPLSSACDWRDFIPEAGVSLISERGLNSYLLSWPGQ